MQKLVLPHVILPMEFVQLLKSNITASTPIPDILDVLRKNPAMYAVLEQAFSEFGDGRSFEKTATALGWANFRDRLASLYVYRNLHGQFPLRTNMDLADEIKQVENQFSSHGVHGYARAFLLGFYLRLANLQIQKRENNRFLEIKLPEELSLMLKLSQGRTEKVDWLILIVLHLLNGLGDKMLLSALTAGRKFEELYPLMSTDARKLMMDNLLAYGASINEPDIFVYDKV